MPRRHDIDALRVIAFALLILYHCAMVYVAEWDFHIKSTYTAEWLQWPMIAMNRWRMPLLFMISGIAIGLARVDGRRTRFAAARSWRLLLPLLFGMFVVVTPQTYFQIIAQYHYTGGFAHFYKLYLTAGLCRGGQCLTTPTWNHLWYLAYLWPYTILLLALAPILGRTGAWFQAPARQRLAGWLLATGPVLWLAAVNLWLAPRYPETHALFGDWTVHAESLPLFLIGYLVAKETGFWANLARLRWRSLAVAMLAISVELSLRWLGRHPLSGPLPEWIVHVPWYTVERVARATYTWTALLTIFGWARTLLDRPFRWLPYCSEAVFSWYILHQTLIVALAYGLLRLRLGPIAEPLLLITGTVAGCLLLHELLVRRIPWLRPLFGLKPAALDAGTAAPASCRPAEQEAQDHVRSGTQPVAAVFASPWLTALMQGITFFGYDWLYAAVVIGLGFGWKLRPMLGVMLALLLSGVCTHAVKDGLQLPRPVQVDARVLDKGRTNERWQAERGGAATFFTLPDRAAIAAQRAAPEPDYGFLSGHVAAAAALCVTFVLWRPRRRWMWFALCAWPFLMALSRMYLGRHFLADVLAGAVPRWRPARSGAPPSLLVGLATLLAATALLWTPMDRVIVGQLLGLSVTACILRSIGWPEAVRAPWRRIARVIVAFAVYALAKRGLDAWAEEAAWPHRHAMSIPLAALGTCAVMAGAAVLCRSLGLNRSTADIAAAA